MQGGTSGINPHQWAKDCCSKSKGEALVTQAEEDNEPTLLMAHATLSSTSSVPDCDEIQTPHGRQLLHFIEERVFVQLDAEADYDDSLWCLNSGTTNHMLGCRRAFIDIDTSIRGTLKFDDGSEVTIEGSGTVM
jgi:hypothetical protein